MGKLDRVNGRRWVIPKVDTIVTSPKHRCIRRFYIGIEYLELEFYPCVAYKNLTDDFRKLYSHEASYTHRLRYNPLTRVAPCSKAVSRLRDYIVYNNIELVLYYESHDSYNAAVIMELCRELKVDCVNIGWVPTEYVPIIYC